MLEIFNGDVSYASLKNASCCAYLSYRASLKNVSSLNDHLSGDFHDDHQERKDRYQTFLLGMRILAIS